MKLEFFADFLEIFKFSFDDGKSLNIFQCDKRAGWVSIKEAFYGSSNSIFRS